MATISEINQNGIPYEIRDENTREKIINHESSIDNPHSVTKEQVGLGNVDNTSDLNKPISTAVQEALNGVITCDTSKIDVSQTSLGGVELSTNEGAQSTEINSGSARFKNETDVASDSSVIGSTGVSARRDMSSSDYSVTLNIDGIEIRKNVPVSTYTRSHTATLTSESLDISVEDDYLNSSIHLDTDGIISHSGDNSIGLASDGIELNNVDGSVSLSRNGLTIVDNENSISVTLTPQDIVDLLALIHE